MLTNLVKILTFDDHKNIVDLRLTCILISTTTKHL